MSMEDSFIKLNEQLSKEVCLHLQKCNEKFILETDASGTGLGACLLQKNNEGNIVPIRRASRKLTNAEQNYGTAEKEFLDVVWEIEYFEHQLRGRRFSLITVHIALEAFKNKGEFGNKRMYGWIGRIQ